MPSSHAKPGDPLFFETTVVKDAPGDYLSNSALDLVAVHVSEKYAFDVDKRVGHDIVTVRFEVASVRGVACQTEIRFELFFKGASNATHVFGGLTTYALLGNSSYRCQPRGVPGSGPVVIDPAGLGVTVRVPAASLGVVPGMVLSGLYAQSSLRVGNEFVVQDIAPWDNRNLPHTGNPPSAGLATYVANGSFPFFSVYPTGPLKQYSVGGQEVKYEFDFVSHPALGNDLLRIFFQYPDGWSVSPSLGQPGPPPVGVLSGGPGGELRPFAFRVWADKPVDESDAAAVVMEAISDSGGHAIVTTTTAVSGSRIVDPALIFSLLTPGPFESEGTSLLRFSILSISGGPVDARAAVDVSSERIPITSADADSVGGGVYEVATEFPRAGQYTIDVYLPDLKPSPHQEFELTVESRGRGAPGPEASYLIVAFGLGFLMVRRRR